MDCPSHALAHGWYSETCSNSSTAAKGLAKWRLDGRHAQCRAEADTVREGRPPKAWLSHQYSPTEDTSICKAVVGKMLRYHSLSTVARTASLKSMLEHGQ